MGCCDAAAGFLGKIGSLSRVEFAETIEFVGTKGERLKIRASSLPAPFHLLPSVLQTGCLRAGEKLALVRLLSRVAMRQPDAEANARDYFASLGCPPRLMDALIEPILVAALNESAGEASAEYARMALLQSLAASRGGYRLGVPRVPLAELIDAPARRYLGSRGCEIRLGARVERLDMGPVPVLRLATGETIRRDCCVCAVPPWRLEEMGSVEGGRLEWRPILAAHMFFRGGLPEFDRVCVAGEPFGWVFNKSRDFGLDRGYVQAVASAAGPIARLRKSDLTYLALRAAAKAAPGIRDADLGRVVVVRAPRATFSTAPGCDAARPGPVSTLPNVFMAGDWTSTGWPATIESAVRSGHAAAQSVMTGGVVESARLEGRTV